MDVGVGLEGLALKRTIGGREGLHGDFGSVDALLPNTDNETTLVDTDWDVISNDDFSDNGDWAFGP